MKLVVFGSSTGMCEEIAGKIAEKAGADCINVTDLTAEKLCGHITVVILRLRQTNRAFQAKSVRSANLLAISTSGLFVMG